MIRLFSCSVRPVLGDALGDDRWDYYFSLKDWQGVTKSYGVTLQFEQGIYQQYTVGKEVFDIRQKQES